MRTSALGLAALICFGAPSWSAAENNNRYTLQLTIGQTRVEGTPLTWSADPVLLLGRDGRLWDFDPDSARDFRKSAPRFQSFTVGEIREQLQRELGQTFEITATGHYLVAHPRGQRDLWGQRFEDLYRTFWHYFKARGFNLSQPEFPLVAVVFPDQGGFLRYAAADDNVPRQGLLGYYSPVSNRIALYDVTHGSSGDDWSTNAATIIHEATHQTAFNCGVHGRFSYTPRWVGEGLGTLFEAPGVWNWRSQSAARERVNREQLAAFRASLKTRRGESLPEMIASDRLFQTSTQAAYAQAWAFTYYLVETQGKKYADFLAKTAARPAFEPYGPAERTADFTSVFGDHWAMIEAHFLRFIAALD